jgi:hypothetical protein
VQLEILDEGRQGILLEGDHGRIFVNRGVLDGAPVAALASAPLRPNDYRLYDFDNLDRPQREGKLDAIINHMGNFFDCVRERRRPISDVEGAHRTVSTCHIANIALRLGRPLQWDPRLELFVNDAEANTWLKREQRAGYEIV